jgi:hypothetical protein
LRRPIQLAMATAFAEVAARHADSPEGSATVDLRRRESVGRAPSVAQARVGNPPKAMLIVAGAELVVVFSLPEKRIGGADSGISSPQRAGFFGRPERRLANEKFSVKSAYRKALRTTRSNPPVRPALRIFYNLKVCWRFCGPLPGLHNGALFDTGSGSMTISTNVHAA